MSGEGETKNEDLSEMLRQFHQIDVKSVMKSNVWDMCFVTPESPIEDIISILSSRKHIWVVSTIRSMKLLGLITERDIIDVLAPRKIDPYNFSWSLSSMHSLLFGGVEKARDVMTTDLVMIGPNHTVGQALLKMKKHQLKRLPVVSKGVLIGEITMKSMIIQFKKIMKWNRILREEGGELKEPECGKPD